MIYSKHDERRHDEECSYKVHLTWQQAWKQNNSVKDAETTEWKRVPYFQTF
jgi:hypothetical protein